jgi:hypothetical protein
MQWARPVNMPLRSSPWTRSSLLHFAAVVGVILLAAALDANDAEVYKWVDEHGVVHYTDRPPAGRECREVDLPRPLPPTGGELQPGPYEQAIEEQKARKRVKEAGLSPPHGAGLPRVPMPESEVSPYFETVSSGISWSTETLCGRFRLTLKPAATLPTVFRVEAHFPDPGDSARERVVSTRGSQSDGRIVLESPRLRGFECKNYRVVVNVFDPRDLETPIGAHYQFIQSTIDLDKVHSAEQLLRAMLHGNCRE